MGDEAAHLVAPHIKAGQMRTVDFNRLATTSSLWLLGMVLYFPALVQHFASLQLSTVFASLLVLGALVSAPQMRPDRSWHLWVLALTSLLACIAFMARGSDSGAGVTSQFFYVYSIPAGGVIGSYLVKAGATSRAATVVVGLGLISSGLAIYEHVMAHPLLNDRLIVEGGFSRASVGQFHPSILATMVIVSMAALVSSGKRYVPRVLATVVLLAGTLSTRSSAPIAIAFMVTLLVLAHRLRTLLRFAPATAVLGILAGLYSAICVWKPTVLGGSIDLYSSEYRKALYALAPEILSIHPLGYGVDGLPAGEWLIATALKGVWDVSTTVDAEPVLLVAEGGYVGLACFIAFTLWLSHILARSGSCSALAATSILLSGMTVAVHAWISLGFTLTITAGAAFQEDRLMRSREGPDLQTQR